jgi:nucleotide-binding universal stress UspA family protein
MSSRNPLKTIIVPTDFSAGAQRALARTALLPLAAGAIVHILHVETGRSARATDAKSQAARDQARRRLAQIAQAAGLKAPLASVKVLTGTPHVEIIRFARSVEADLVVLGRKGAGQRYGQVLGRTSAQVAHKCDIPVLVVGPRPQSAYQRPLLAMELEPSVRALVSLVRDVVGPKVKTLLGVHAFHVPFEGLIAPGSDRKPSPYHQQIRDEAEKRLRQFMAKVDIKGHRLRVALRRGQAPAVVLRHAREEGADLIALGTHGRVGIAHAIIGSVAESVVIGATRDVLIARPVRYTFEEA